MLFSVASLTYKNLTEASVRVMAFFSMPMGTVLSAIICGMMRTIVMVRRTKTIDTFSQLASDNAIEVAIKDEELRQQLALYQDEEDLMLLTTRVKPFINYFRESGFLLGKIVSQSLLNSLMDSGQMGELGRAFRDLMRSFFESFWQGFFKLETAFIAPLSFMTPFINSLGAPFRLARQMKGFTIVQIYPINGNSKWMKQLHSL